MIERWKVICPFCRKEQQALSVAPFRCANTEECGETVAELSARHILGYRFPAEASERQLHMLTRAKTEQPERLRHFRCQDWAGFIHSEMGRLDWQRYKHCPVCQAEQLRCASRCSRCSYGFTLRNDTPITPKEAAA